MEGQWLVTATSQDEKPRSMLSGGRKSRDAAK